MPEIELTPLAKADLIEIWHYGFSQWGEVQADTYLLGLEEAIQSLADNPRIGVSIDDIRSGCRQYTFRKHLIIYRLNGDRLIILRVLRVETDRPRHI